LVGEEYIWRWETKFYGNGEEADRCFRSLRFKVRTLRAGLAALRGDFVPSLSNGRADVAAQAMDGNILAEMAQAQRSTSSIFPVGKMRSTEPQLAARFSL